MKKCLKMVLLVAILCVVASSMKTFSEDGGKIAFASNASDNWEIYVMNADGSNLQKLTNDPGVDTSPDWSPDGKKIAFESNRAAKRGLKLFDIYIMDADGGNVQKITNGRTPSWSSDGTKIVYNRNDEIYVMSPDGNNKKRLAKSGWILSAIGAYEACWTYDPTWSPDGKRIAFGLSRGATISDLTIIAVMNADGSNKKGFVPQGIINTGPAWSPDGSKIAFSSGSDYSAHLCIANPDGSNLIDLTKDSPCDGPAGTMSFSPVTGVSPSWSPDGTRIALVINYQICIMNVDGTDLTQVTTTGHNGAPAWSPL